MNKVYESTRNRNDIIAPSEAILKGLSDNGGLFVMRDLENKSCDIKKIVKMNYFEMAEEVFKIFLPDFTNEEIHKCVLDAYTNKFSSDEITPVVELEDGYILELFNGPTSAFKDVGLSMLPQLTKTALNKTNQKEDILILTATSGDTGKAALEGFKDVDRCKIIVFYPNNGVSTVQEAQMKTQTGKNVSVCAIEGNFDDAQSGIKEIFVDAEFKKVLAQQNICLSSANSINIGRLIPQMIYYFYAYASLVKKGKIVCGDKINFVVPTGNFGNILAGYYAKKIGLPVHKLVCASNSNNVLYDFIKTGVYNKKRDFLKTISPSMDILISSNLERLLYYMSDCDNEYIASLMKSLNETGEYKVNEKIFSKLKEEFSCGYCSNEDTQTIIKEIYEKDHYLLDPHTAVAYKVLLENKDEEHVSVVLSTASPYKFTKSVFEALSDEINEDEFVLMKKLSEMTNTEIPYNLKDLDKKEILHNNVIEREDMRSFVLKTLEVLK